MRAVNENYQALDLNQWPKILVFAANAKSQKNVDELQVIVVHCDITIF